ncbi:MAG: class I SAM-dependent methyltransferase [Actinomycetota bacterium]|nr:class I SAM-dependent methyltransferase [Actinomycetota bacterium]MDQ6945715.1 class I SAM-dependent methyltransferase [Actinomycetota bacterium]
MSVDDEIRDYWDADAATYDDAPGHRPTSAAVQAAWAGALARLLPSSPARVLDCGAGTGFLSLMAARQGHQVTALDTSPRMLERLRGRAVIEGLAIEVVEGLASAPPPGPFDAVMERHLVWTLPDPAATLAAWRTAAPLGRLVLFENLWPSADAVEALLEGARGLLRRFRRSPDDHHGAYPSSVAQALPLGPGTHPSALVETAREAGWPDPWMERLRDVDWSSSLELPLPERLLGVRPRFVVASRSLR